VDHPAQFGRGEVVDGIEIPSGAFDLDEVKCRNGMMTTNYEAKFNRDLQKHIIQEIFPQ
jgi:hypothetical protein